LPFCQLQLHAPKPLSRSYQQVVVTLGDHIRKRRLDLGLLQREVAEQLGATTLSVTNWEKNHTEPELRFLPAIIRFLGAWHMAEPATLADQIRTARLVRGMSQKKMAELLELDPGTIARYEHGLRQPRGSYREKILDFLRSPVSNPA
jgi:transcriptional regulator with XRE-family HTH domain